jgi:hypothetical protein
MYYVEKLNNDEYLPDSNPWVLSIAGITCASTLGPVGSTESIVKMSVIIILCIYIFHHFFIASYFFFIASAS